MTEVRLHLISPGSAEGWYCVKAKGCMLAVLYWGDERGPFSDWSPISYVPVDPAGNGAFYFPNNRAVPGLATHVWTKVYARDFASSDWIKTAIPQKFLPENTEKENALHFSVLTDLHLSRKPWKVRRALKAVGSDIVFLLGDMTNDGLKEQFEIFQTCIDELAPEKVLFPVTGNHDAARIPSAGETDGCESYRDFQNALLSEAVRKGFDVSFAPDGRAYSVKIGDIDIIALQCVTAGRRFLFPGGSQIEWLDERLSETEAQWHIVLCHAPMIRHNPSRNDGPAYLDGNKRIQEILDRTGRVIFLSGHTHVSPNGLSGNAEYDCAHNNIYLDCASVVATDTSGEHGLMHHDWKDGCVTELSISGTHVLIHMRSIDAGVNFSRGCYRFKGIEA